MTGVVGAPKRVTTCSIHCAVDWDSQPRCWPQPVHTNSPACGPLAGPMVQTLRQHGRSRSVGRSSFTRTPINVGAPKRSVFMRALLVRRRIENRVGGLRRCSEQPQRLLVAVEALVTGAAARQDVADAFFAVVDVAKWR